MAADPPTVRHLSGSRGASQQGRNARRPGEHVRPRRAGGARPDRGRAVAGGVAGPAAPARAPEPGRVRRPVARGNHNRLRAQSPRLRGLPPPTEEHGLEHLLANRRFERILGGAAAARRLRAELARAWLARRGRRRRPLYRQADDRETRRRHAGPAAGDRGPRRRLLDPVGGRECLQGAGECRDADVGE